MQAISQTLRFVDSVGYHEPSECVPSKIGGGVQQRNSAEVTPKLIGRVELTQNLLNQFLGSEKCCCNRMRIQDQNHIN